MSSGTRVLICGYYGFRNLGDEAVLSAIMGDLRSRLAEAVFTVTSGDPEETRRTHGVEAIFWRDVPALVASVRDCDLVIIGGGGLFHDYWGVDPESVLASHYYGISFFASPAVLAAAEGVPVAVYGVGVGPLTSDPARELTRAVFDVAQVATVRDQESLDLLMEIGVSQEHVELTADPAFRLATPSQDEIAAAAAEAGLGGARGPCLGVVLREWSVGVDQEAWLAEVTEAVGSFIADHDGEAVLLPFQDLEGEAEDSRLAQQLCSRLEEPDRVAVVAPLRSVSRAKALIAGCDLVLGMRLHAVVFAASTGVPVVALSYSPKVRRLMSRLGCEALTFDLDAVEAGELRDGLETALSSRKGRRTRLAQAASKLARLAERNAQITTTLLRGRPAGDLPLSPQSRRLVASVAESAVLRAEAKTASAEGLVAQRDGLLAQRDGLLAQRDALAEQVRDLRQERESLMAERDELAGQRNALTVERDELAVERDAAGRAREQAEASLEDLQKVHQGLVADHANLEGVLYRITSSRAFRLISVYWRVRGGFSEVVQGGVRGSAKKILPASVKQEIRRRRGGGALPAMSWYAYAFDRYKRERCRRVCAGLAELSTPCRPGFVSVVLPVYNGADMVRESLESILAQTYRDWELIAIDDGSMDETGTILDEYASRDPRIRVVHQENRKIPRTLSRGFRMAEGEFLTWTSADNRMKPRFLELMVGCLQRHQEWDMVYANLDIIGPDGSFLQGSEWYAGYQVPPGSEHIHMPLDPSELNIWPNNYVGGAFMYRSRVAWLLGDYSALRFTAEDYDYWMRINELLELRHADFDEPVYDYRFHPGSLTARDEELGITRDRTKLMVFDDFRRDLASTPFLYRIEDSRIETEGLASELRRHADRAGGIVLADNPGEAGSPPRLWMASTVIRVVAGEESVGPPPQGVPEGCLTVLAAAGGPPAKVDPAWDLCLLVGGAEAHPLPGERRGWMSVPDAAALLAAVEVRLRSREAERVERAIAEVETTEPLEASVIVCTHQVIEPLRAALASLAGQQFDPEKFEVILVNNNPDDEQLSREIETIRSEIFSARPGLLHVVVSPVPGLSHARNAGISHAQGEVVLFLDDDAVAPDSWVAEAVRLFRENPEAGVIGGHIRLEVPEPRPAAVGPGWERYWSQFLTGAGEYREVEHWWQFPWGASWCARRRTLLEMGGFRSRYGRSRHDFSGGEEVIAATLAQRLGYTVGVAPELEVEHRVVASRFTWNHVRRTIIAGTLVNYQAQRDLYLPMEARIGKTLRRLLSPSVDRTVGAATAGARIRHWLYRKEAWLRLLRRQLADRLLRMKRPVALGPRRRFSGSGR